MKILKPNNSHFDAFRNMTDSPHLLLVKKKDSNEFDFYLDEFLNEEIRDWDESPILLPRHGRFWDNGYEDVE